MALHATSFNRMISHGIFVVLLVHRMAVAWQYHGSFHESYHGPVMVDAFYDRGSTFPLFCF